MSPEVSGRVPGELLDSRGRPVLPLSQHQTAQTRVNASQRDGDNDHISLVRITLIRKRGRRLIRAWLRLYLRSAPPTAQRSMVLFTLELNTLTR